ncbi:hypothetical protein [Sulfurivirga sp.]|uniref:hypothetical protein n=1 Tax=Sulfurivirga sp. TaxID=2614236 RepID=UPI0025F98E22|nr:hypothetical protein [Sulfurivirga sp.]
MDDLLPPIAVTAPPPPAPPEPAMLLPWLLAGVAVLTLLLVWLARRRLRRLWWRLRLSEERAGVIAAACYRHERSRLSPRQRRTLELIIFAPRVSRETVSRLREVLDAL